VDTLSCLKLFPGNLFRPKKMKLDFFHVKKMNSGFFCVNLANILFGVIHDSSDFCADCHWHVYTAVHRGAELVETVCMVGLN
jgi:hypothetical protein